MDTDSTAQINRMEAADRIPPKQRSAAGQTRRLPFALLNHVIEFISRTNLFVLCCIAACFSLISYLAAFSCEISWILEAHGNLPTTSYLLCSGYFILFVASTILIHGLATGLPWGLFSWSVIIGALGIPELCLVMMITTQFWGLQSTHGLTELIGYIIRLCINCLALLCVIPTALRWRREQQVLKQLQGLASRLQLQTPAPNSQKTNSILSGSGPDHQQYLMQQQQQHQGLSRQGSRATTTTSKNRRRRHSGVDNPAFIVHESQLPFPFQYGVYGSQNEFNASIFGLDPAQYAGGGGGGGMPPQQMNPSRTRSLLDLRSSMHIVEPTHPTNDKKSSKKTTIPDHTSDYGEPMYYTIGSEKDTTDSNHNQSTHSSGGGGGTKSLPTPLMRNCVSMENLMGIQMLHTADAATAEQHRRNALMMQQHPLSQIYNPAAAAEAAEAAAQATATKQQGGDQPSAARQPLPLPQLQHPGRMHAQQHHFMMQQAHHPQLQQRMQHYPLSMYHHPQSPAWPPPPPAYGHQQQPHDFWNWNRYAYANDARRFVHPFLAGPQNYAQMQQQQQHMQHMQPHPQQQQQQPAHHFSRSTMNSKQSLGSDDFRKYRDVAL